MILCCGEALIDMVPTPEGTFRPLPGGSVYNSAVALGRLGAPTGFLWPLSRDLFGDVLRAPLEEAGVSTALCPVTDRHTTLAFVTLTGGEARYDFFDEGSAGRLFAPADLPADLGEAEALLIGGISLVPDPVGATIEALAAREAGRLAIMLDPNIRPAFIADPAAHRARLLRLTRLAKIVKLSVDDLDWLWPGRPHVEAAGEVLSRGAQLVLLTAGAGGATAFRRGLPPVHVPAEAVTVADTIGAGDTFNAGVLAGLHSFGALGEGGGERIAHLHPDDLAQALRLGVRAAAICVGRPGANPPWAEEI